MTGIKRRTLLKAAGYSALYGGLVADFAQVASALTPRQLAGDDPDLHLLRRISFGPVAAELARVKAIGRAAYIEEQLAQPDDATLLAIAQYPLIALDANQVWITSAGGFTIDSHLAQLQSAAIYRAVFSRAQLYEVMVDFWNDHFNTYFKKNPIPLKLCFDREVIRAHALGNFKTLLRATVHHPEMLYYLDNWMNAKDSVNENYARELLELHTMGKDGGYTEADMKALSRILTGLTFPIDPAAGLVTGYDRHLFDPLKHDASEKTFLGQRFPANGGEEEIGRALDLILDHPGTARFIALKLCRRFVTDHPPEALVARVAQRFTATGGDIREMLRALLGSPEFEASAGQKVRRPLEAIIGAVRACGVNQYDYSLNTDLYGGALFGGGILFDSLVTSGQQPFGWVPPNGYPDSTAYWSNTNSLLHQQKFLVRLAEAISYAGALERPPEWLMQGNSVGTNVARATTPRQAVEHAIRNLLFMRMPPEAEGAALAFVAQDAEPGATMEAGQLEMRVKGLVFALLSSPWFLQR